MMWQVHNRSPAAELVPERSGEGQQGAHPLGCCCVASASRECSAQPQAIMKARSTAFARCCNPSSLCKRTQGTCRAVLRESSGMCVHHAAMRGELLSLMNECVFLPCSTTHTTPTTRRQVGSSSSLQNLPRSNITDHPHWNFAVALLQCSAHEPAITKCPDQSILIIASG